MRRKETKAQAKILKSFLKWNVYVFNPGDKRVSFMMGQQTWMKKIVISEKNGNHSFSHNSLKIMNLLILISIMISWTRKRFLVFTYWIQFLRTFLSACTSVNKNWKILCKITSKKVSIVYRVDTRWNSVYLNYWVI